MMLFDTCKRLGAVEVENIGRDLKVGFGTLHDNLQSLSDKNRTISYIWKRTVLNLIVCKYCFECYQLESSDWLTVESCQIIEL